jgi:hypothetical protein
MRVVSSSLVAAAAAVLTSISAFGFQRLLVLLRASSALPTRFGRGRGAWLPAELLVGHLAWAAAGGFSCRWPWRCSAVGRSGQRRSASASSLLLMAAPCSSTCSRDAVDRQRDPGRGETLQRGEQRGCWTAWTRRVCVDGDRFTHNPEVAGSNPAPATSFRRSRPFPSRERAFGVSDAVAKRVAAAGLRAA